MPAPDRSRAMEHIVVALFENRSLDNVLGHLYGPEDGKTFDGVIGKDLSNPIPAWAEHTETRPPVWVTTAAKIDPRRSGSWLSGALGLSGSGDYAQACPCPAPATRSRARTSSRIRLARIQALVIEGSARSGYEVKE